MIKKVNSSRCNQNGGTCILRNAWPLVTNTADKLSVSKTVTTASRSRHILPATLQVIGTVLQQSREMKFLEILLNKNGAVLRHKPGYTSLNGG